MDVDGNLEKSENVIFINIAAKENGIPSLKWMQVSFGFGWALFYNISTLWCYSMLNPVYIYIYMIGKFVVNIFKWARTYLFTHS